MTSLEKRILWDLSSEANKILNFLNKDKISKEDLRLAIWHVGHLRDTLMDFHYSAKVENPKE